MNKELLDVIQQLCKNLSTNYRVSNSHKQDIYQEGVLACLEALKDYDPDAYEKPEMYFFFPARRAMSNYYNRGMKLITPPHKSSEARKSILLGETTLKQEEALRGAIFTSHEDCDLLDDTDTEGDYTNKDFLNYLYNLVDEVLTDEELQVIKLRYLSGTEDVLSYRTIAKMMGVSPATVSERHATALMTLSKAAKL